MSSNTGGNTDTNKKRPERSMASLHPLLLLLQRHPNFAIAVSESISANECDFLARVLLQISGQSEYRMKLIKTLISHELIKYQHMPQNIFRSNSLASKLLGFYVRDVGGNYLRLVLGDLLSALLDEDCDLEVDPLKLNDSQEKKTENEQKLIAWTEKILDRMMDEDIKSQMPIEVRLVASYISHVSDSLQLDTPVLIGGYIMLRFFNPAIATPDAFGLTNKSKGEHGQRNLILISKIIQNLANGVLFGQKEQFMASLNPFLEAKKQTMRNYLTNIITFDVGNSDKDSDTIPPQNEYPKVEEFPQLNKEIHHGNADTDLGVLNLSDKDCSKLYKLIWASSPSVISYLINHGVKYLRKCSDFMGECIRILRSIEDIGAPGEENVKERVVDIFQSMLNKMQEHYFEIDNSEFENKYIIYTPDSSSSIRTVYISLHRASMELWTVPEQFGCFIFTLCKILYGHRELSAVNLVIDCSLVYIGPPHKSLITTLFNTFKTYLPNAKLKNVILLQATGCANIGSTQVQSFIYGVLKILAKKEEFKLYDLNCWEKLPEIVTLSQTLLPEESKIFAEQGYNVVKVNPKGKHQDRTIVITPKSILNIDPKTYSIKNERLLSEVEEIIAPTSNLEIHMKFRPILNGSPNDDSGKPFFSSKSKDDIEKELVNPSYIPDYVLDIDSVFRRYILSSLVERSLLLEDLFETTVRSQFVNAPTAYQIQQALIGEDNITLSNEEILQQLSKKKALDNRILKFTNNNILEVEKRTVKTRLPFISIASFEVVDNIYKDEESSSVDEGKKNASDISKVIILKLKHEGSYRVWRLRNNKIVTENDLIESLKEGVHRVEEIVRMRKIRRAEADNIREEEEKKKVKLAQEDILNRRNTGNINSTEQEYKEKQVESTDNQIKPIDV
jgi:hypothetical protein